MYALSLKNLRAVEGFDDNLAKGSSSDVDFFPSSGTLPHPWPIHNFCLPSSLEHIGDRWREVLRYICHHSGCSGCTCGGCRSGGLETSNGVRRRSGFWVVRQDDRQGTTPALSHIYSLVHEGNDRYRISSQKSISIQHMSSCCTNGAISSYWTMT